MKGLETNNTFIIVIPMENDEKQNQKVANEKFQWRQQSLTMVKESNYVKIYTNLDKGKKDSQKHK